MWRWKINKNQCWDWRQGVDIFPISPTSSIIHHEWNSYLMTLKRSEAPVTHQTLSCWWIKNGIKWASLLTLSLSTICMDIQCAFCCSAFRFFFYTLSHSRSMLPPKKMLYFYSNSFFFVHTFFLLIERLWSSLIFGSVYSGRVSWVLSRYHSDGTLLLKFFIFSNLSWKS